MKKRWVYREQHTEEEILQLSKQININPHLATILLQRGIANFEQAKSFFRPSLDMLLDPFLMLGMDQAVNRLTDAIFNDERVLIYGDYDVDGTTSVSLIYLFLSQFSSNLEYYIPDRYSEGYGISEQGIDYAIANEFALIISLDCGIRANARAEQAKSAGIDLIICDHHLPGESLPDALAILDPKQKNCKYPFKELSGCGVGFKLLEGFCQQNTIEKERVFQYLDLVAVSIASDIVPIVGENRVLAYFGLRKLNQSPSAGLASLIEISGKKQEFSISDVVFSLGPRINAAGRLTHARESVKLLISGVEGVEGLAENLNDRNQERRAFDQSITEEALDMISESSEPKKTTVLYKKDWHKGVIGIVASRCIEHYHRPTIILTESKGKATGSARSVPGFDIHEAIGKCADLLEQFGGHMYAAGLTLPIENVQAFATRFEEVVSQTIADDLLTPKIEIDVEVPLDFVNFKTFGIMNQMAPFGPQNMAPSFGTKNVKMDRVPKIIKEKHIKGYVRTEGSQVKQEFIGFNMAELGAQIKPNEPFDIVYHIEENNYLGNRSLVLNLRDIRLEN